MANAARYDDYTDWYVSESATWDAEPVSPLPDGVSGQRVLEIACGYGRVARHLAGLGVQVTGIDLSAKLITHAQEIENREPLGIRYVHGDAATTDWWDGEAFDGVICDMALMDIDDLEGTLSAAAVVLVDGGWFAFSLVHPCYPGGPGTLSGLPSWPSDRGYAAEGWWSGGIGLRGRVGANHRMLSTYLNAVLRAGFEFAEFVEQAFVVPRLLGARCVKTGGR